ncbi:hypothetical protein [Amycolatopsis sp. GM8]|uniref:hypothetical protein n=1 Tax=Amycolatopsis sp. GM8 TaxID=2896530 RepID=UPI001F3746C0|nr:hypothetical protein [Amycolatopsis sp. GM8]
MATPINPHHESDEHAANAKQLRDEAKASPGLAESALWSEALLEALLSIRAEIRIASDEQAALWHAITRHSNRLEDAVNALVRVAGSGGNRGF